MAENEEGHNERVRLEELVVGELPERVLQSLEKMEITIEELNEWSGSVPPLRFESSENHFSFFLRAKIPKKRLYAILGSLGAVIGTAFSVLIANLDKVQSIIRILMDAQ